MFEPERLPPRDEHGWTRHPDLPEWGENEDGEAFWWLRGFEAAFIDAPERFRKRGDFSQWTPRRPKGHGWRLVAIYDHEDGPYALYLRPLVRVQACRPEDRAMLASPEGQELLRAAMKALADMGPNDGLSGPSAKREGRA